MPAETQLTCLSVWNKVFLVLFGCWNTINGISKLETRINLKPFSTLPPHVIVHLATNRKHTCRRRCRHAWKTVTWNKLSHITAQTNKPMQFKWKRQWREPLARFKWVTQAYNSLHFGEAFQTVLTSLRPRERSNSQCLPPQTFPSRLTL